MTLANGAGLGGVLALACIALAAPSQDSREPSAPWPLSPARTDCYGDVLPEAALARFGTLRLRQSFEACLLSISADGRIAAAKDFDSVVRLWEIPSGRLLRRLEKTCNTFAFSPRGPLAIAPVDAISLIDPYTQQELMHFDAPLGCTLAIAFSADGKQMASASRSGALIIWDVATGRQLRTLPVSAADGYLLAFSPDGRVLASSCREQVIRLWDPATGKELRQLHGHEDAVLSLAFSSDGAILASGGADKVVRLWDVATGRQLRVSDKEKHAVESVAFAPASSVLAATGDEIVKLWEPATGKLVRSWPGHASRITRVAFTPDGTVLVSAAHRQSSIRLWDTASGKELSSTASHYSPIGYLHFSDSGKTLISRARDGLIQWEIATTAPHRLPSVPAMDDVTAMSSDRRLVAGSGYWSDHVVRLRDSASGKETRSFGKHRCLSLAFSPDGKLLAGGGDGNFVLWSCLSGKAIWNVLGHGSLFWSLRFSPDGKSIATAGWDHTVGLWDVTSGKQLRKFVGHAAPLCSIAFSPDGKFLASAGFNGKVRLWQVDTGREGRPLLGPQDGARILAFSPDGRLLASGGDRNDPDSIHLWEVLTGDQVEVFHGHDTDVTALEFSRDSRQLACGGANGVVMLWDVTGRRTKRLPPFSSQDVATCWTDLGDSDAGRAWRAMWAMVEAPNLAVPFFRERLRPIGIPEPARVSKLLANLYSDNFDERNAATKELEALGELAEPQLRREHDVCRSSDVRRTLAELLKKLEPMQAPPGLQALRAVAVLEHIGSPEARKILGRLAKGARAARLTQEARVALERLGRRNVAFIDCRRDGCA
jgi:WD40 repeat protein